MSEADDKLKALEEILGVDDTEELNRPPAQRSVGEILSGLAPAESPQEMATPTAAVEPLVERAVQRERASPAEPLSAHPPSIRPSISRTPKVRTSSLLPVDFAERFETAKDRRWGFADLVSAALERDLPSEADAEQVLFRYEGAPRSLRSFSLGTETMSSLDAAGERWRMNRSQVLTVLLDREFEAHSF